MKGRQLLHFYGNGIGLETIIITVGEINVNMDRNVTRSMSGW
jgi:hypothetical protein